MKRALRAPFNELPLTLARQGGRAAALLAVLCLAVPALGTPLHQAARHGHVEEVRALLARILHEGGSKTAENPR